MNIWYAGAPIAAALGLFGRGNARLIGHHVARGLPFLLAFGINFGIIPLLFMQVAYYQFFYPATILMAWPWFAVFWLVMMAYLATYLYRLVIRGGAAAETASVGEVEHETRTSDLLSRVGTIAIFLAAGIFLVVGFIFNNALSLMTNVAGWPEIFRNQSVSSAVTGLAINYNDSTLIPRWLFVFGLAITTTAVYIAIDAAFLSRRESDDYRRYAGHFAFLMYSTGLIWFAACGSWYVLGRLGWAVDEMLAQPVMRILFPIAALSPGLPWLLLFVQCRGPKPQLAALAGIAQFGVIALNGITRQWVQNSELGPFADLARRPVDLQLGATLLFLFLLAAMGVLVGWMLKKIVEVNRREWDEGR